MASAKGMRQWRTSIASVNGSAWSIEQAPSEGLSQGLSARMHMHMHAVCSDARLRDGAEEVIRRLRIRMKPYVRT